MAHFFPAAGDSGGSDAERSLAQAFAFFTEAAGSLERSYAELQVEVDRLRQDLEITNRDLTWSLDENRKTRLHLHQILESLPCGVVVTHENGEIITANPEARRLLAMSASCDHINDLPPSVGAALRTASRHASEDQASSPFDVECTLASQNGERSLAVRHAQLESGQERAQAVYILRDITEQKAFESQRESLRQQQALIEVSSLLAHEIRNPLGSLELFAGLLAEAELNPECQGWVEHVQAGLRTMSATVNNVLQLHDRPQTELASTDLGELLRWAHGFLSPVARQARVQIEVINHLDGVVIPADRHQLEQVLLNLSLNALRFMPGGGWLSLRGRRRADAQGPFVELSVIDTGPGIDDQVLGRIFEPGFSTCPGSPGLGLAVARKIVERHGGSISVQSRPGHGARFFLRFPRGGVGA